MSREQAERAVDAIFDDLRGRRTLKWLFDPEPENCGPIADGINVIDRETQSEIRETWIGFVISASQYEKS